jgi:hypothetical protein
LAQQMMDYWTNFATYGCGFWEIFKI